MRWPRSSFGDLRLVAKWENSFETKGRGCGKEDRLNVRKKDVMVSGERPVRLSNQIIKHRARRLLLAVILAILSVMPCLLYPASAVAVDTLDQSQAIALALDVLTLKNIVVNK